MSEQSEAELKYGITSSDTTIFLKNNRTVEIPLERGQLFQIVNEIENETFIKIYTYHQKSLLATAEIYYIHSNFEIIDETLWNMLIAFRNQHRRMQIVNNVKFRYFLRNLKKGDEINVSGRALGQFSNKIPCEVRYIGTVPEIGPGIFFGFMIKNSTDKNDRRSQLVEQYCKCRPERGFIRSAEALMHTSSSRSNNLCNNNQPITINGLSFEMCSTSKIHSDKKDDLKTPNQTEVHEINIEKDLMSFDIDELSEALNQMASLKNKN